MSTHKMCFLGKIRKAFVQITLLSKAILASVIFLLLQQYLQYSGIDKQTGILQLQVLDRVWSKCEQMTLPITVKMAQFIKSISIILALSLLLYSKLMNMPTRCSQL